MDFLFVSTAIIIFVQENILERILVFQSKSWLHCPKKKFVNGNVFLDGRKCLSIHEEMFLWVLITSMERKKLSC